MIKRTQSCKEDTHALMMDAVVSHFLPQVMHQKHAW